jgi:hypothetical protein
MPDLGPVIRCGVPWLGAALIMALLCCTAAAAADSQCVACHMDRARLKALTPPDPEPSETGEG